MTAWPSLETLSKSCRWDERTLKKWRKSLFDKGVIRVVEQPGKSNVYSFQWGGFGVYNDAKNVEISENIGGAKNVPPTKNAPTKNAVEGGHKMYPELVNKELVNNINKEKVSANADVLLKKSLEPIDESFTHVEAPTKKRKNAPGAQKEKKVEALPPLDFSNFDNPGAAEEIFTRWLKYRNEIKKPYRSQDTILTSLKNLFNYSAGVSKIAVQIIEKSIGNGYQGFFKPDVVNQNNLTPRPAQKSGINHFGGDMSKYLEPQIF